MILMQPDHKLQIIKDLNKIKIMMMILGVCPQKRRMSMDTIKTNFTFIFPKYNFVIDLTCRNDETSAFI